MKAIVEVGYKKYVMDAKEALTLLEMLGKAEMYETKWSQGSSSHYIYPQDQSEFIRELRIMPQALYNIAKLAGKPERE